MVMRYKMLVILLASASIHAAHRCTAGCLQDTSDRSSWLQQQQTGGSLNPFDPSHAGVYDLHQQADPVERKDIAPDVQDFLTASHIVLTNGQNVDVFRPDGANVGIVFIYEQTISEYRLVTVAYTQESFSKEVLQQLLPTLNRKTPKKTVVFDTAAEALCDLGLALNPGRRKLIMPWIIDPKK